MPLTFYYISTIIGLACFGIFFFYWRKRSVDLSALSLLFFLELTLLLISLIVSDYADADIPLVNLLSILFFVNLVLIPPFMYFCLVQYYTQAPILKNLEKQLNHFYIPIGLLIINLVFFVVIYTSDTDSMYQVMSGDVLAFLNFIALLVIFPLQNVYYIYQAFRLHHKMEPEKAISFFSSLKRRNWATFFISSYLTILTLIIFRQIGLFDNWDIAFLMVMAGIFILTWYIGSQVFLAEENQGMAVAKQTKDTTNSITAATVNSTQNLLNETQQEQIFERILSLLETDKIYLQQDLSLSHLSKIANTNAKYLRTVIRNKTDRNFTSYINSFRVKEAERLLSAEDAQQYTIEAIGEQAGFKSKSAFYAAFKNELGITPKVYRDQRNA